MILYFEGAPFCGKSRLIKEFAELDGATEVFTSESANYGTLDPLSPQAQYAAYGANMTILEFAKYNQYKRWLVSRSLYSSKVFAPDALPPGLFEHWEISAVRARAGIIMMEAPYELLERRMEEYQQTVLPRQDRHALTRERLADLWKIFQGEWFSHISRLPVATVRYPYLQSNVLKAIHELEEKCLSDSRITTTS